MKLLEMLRIRTLGQEGLTNLEDRWDPHGLILGAIWEALVRAMLGLMDLVTNFKGPQLWKALEINHREFSSKVEIAVLDKALTCHKGSSIKTRVLDKGNQVKIPKTLTTTPEVVAQAITTDLTLEVKEMGHRD